MGERIVRRGGEAWRVVAEPLPDGHWAARVVPPGGPERYVRWPDKTITNPVTGQGADVPGDPVAFASQGAALDAGEDAIRRGSV